MVKEEYPLKQGLKLKTNTDFQDGITTLKKSIH